MGRTALHRYNHGLFGVNSNHKVAFCRQFLLSLSQTLAGLRHAKTLLLIYRGKHVSLKNFLFLFLLDLLGRTDVAKWRQSDIFFEQASLIGVNQWTPVEITFQVSHVLCLQNENLWNLENFGHLQTCPKYLEISNSPPD